MNLTRPLLQQASAQGIITQDQAEALWKFMNAHSDNTPSFRFTHILYYLGGLIAIGAMTLFMTLGWESFGGWGILGISLGYILVGLLLTENFLYRKHLPIPAGIVGTFVVALTPLAIYGFQHGMGWWADGFSYRDYHTYIDWRWIFMELGTLAAGTIMLWRYRLPFMVMPMAVTLWYMSMDLVPFLFGDEDYSWHLRSLFSIWFGLGMTLVALFVDLRNRSSKDYAFWLYVFGVLTFWGGLSSQHSGSEVNKLLYMCINLGLILIGAALSRKVFVIFGGLGVSGYLGHLAYTVFEDSLMFPFMLTLIGLGVIYLGILWQHNEHRIQATLGTMMPTAMRELVERRR